MRRTFFLVEHIHFSDPWSLPHHLNPSSLSSYTTDFMFQVSNKFTITSNKGYIMLSKFKNIPNNKMVLKLTNKKVLTLTKHRVTFAKYSFLTRILPVKLVLRTTIFRFGATN